MFEYFNMQNCISLFTLMNFFMFKSLIMNIEKITFKEIS